MLVRPFIPQWGFFFFFFFEFSSTIGIGGNLILYFQAQKEQQFLRQS